MTRMCLVPLEGSDARVLDFVQVLDSLGLIDQKIGTGRIRTETPNLSSIGNVPAVFVGEMSGTNLGIVSRGDLTSFDFSREFFRHGLSLHEQSVVFVG